MKKRLLLLAGFFIGAIIFASPVFASPGKLDKKGGHTCRTNCAKYGLKTGQYHKHGKPKAAKKTAKKVAKTSSKTKCDPNYSKCVPVAKDVDCKPGTGDGPAYTTGPKKVLKKDIYKLDSDKDGLACEPN